MTSTVFPLPSRSFFFWEIGNFIEIWDTFTANGEVHQILVENFTKQKMRSSNWLKTICHKQEQHEATDCGVEIMNRKHVKQVMWYKFMFAVCCKRNSKSFFCQDTTTGFLVKCRLRNNPSNFILITCYYRDLSSASDWSCNKNDIHWYT